jgi:ABC-type branched-subunit amino acid transport system permease subunit
MCSFIFTCLTSSIFTATPQLGKDEGIVGITSLTSTHGYCLLYATAAVVLVLLLKKLEFDTYFGLKIKGIARNEMQMRAMGYNIVKYRFICLFICSLVCSFVGAIFSSHLGVATPALFGIEYSLFPIVVTVIAGIEEGPWSPLAGSLLLVSILRFISTAKVVLLTIICIILVAWFALRPEGFMNYIGRKYRTVDLAYEEKAP